MLEAKWKIQIKDCLLVLFNVNTLIKKLIIQKTLNFKMLQVAIKIKTYKKIKYETFLHLC